MSENRVRGRNERTWNIVLYWKGPTGLAKISSFNLYVLDFPFARDSRKSTEQLVIRKHTYIVKIARVKDVTETQKGDCLVSTSHKVVVRRDSHGGDEMNVLDDRPDLLVRRSVPE